MHKNTKSEFISLRKKIIENDFLKMNDMQKKAIFQTEGPVLILAGAGSGKTTVLVSRITNIIKYGKAYNDIKIPEFVDDTYIKKMEACLNEQHCTDSIAAELSVAPARPWEILAITFTNKAAKELKERISNSLGIIGQDVWASTFHSTCAIMLRKHADRIGFSSHFTIYDTDDSKRLIKDCQSSLNIDDKVLSYKSIMSEISRAKDKLISPHEYKNSVGNDFRRINISKVYSMYQKKLSEADAMDFDDLLVNTVLLFKKCPDVLEYYQNKFKYIMVDEYQDTNFVQYEFIRLLSIKNNNLCVVGDDDQSIYKFRGATIENIMNFEKTFKNAMVIRLEQNYRSTQNILNAANTIIENNKSRCGKTLWTKNFAGDKICVYTAHNEIDEADFIKNQILDKVAEGKNYTDFAILYRMNSQSNSLEKVFVRSGVPYRIVGGHRFYERKEIRDMIAYLSVINNPNDETRLMRIINQPKRSIGSRTIEKLSTLSMQTGESMLNLMRRVDEFADLLRSETKLKSFAKLMDELIAASNDDSISLRELYELILEKTGYVAAIKEEKDESESRIENIRELSSNIVKYEEENGEDASLSGFLEEVSLMTDIDNYNRSANAVTMLTMHSAKGLEFPIVFLPGFEEGIFPGVQTLYNPEEVEEERRLAYVGVTRAKENLYILKAKTRMIFGSTSRYKPSRFLSEIPEELIEKIESDVPARTFVPTMPKLKAVNIIRDFGQFAKPQPKDTTVFSHGDEVSHKVFGKGTILSATSIGNDTLMEIAFDKVGTKKLMANFAKLEKNTC
ncbi:MAG: ATP-dependent DNA helicase PcrA [Eubacteriales bacterium SKADARSKE-1]|nr:ATP-dependent DNA helicase PcrA [Eubacteriales bacterium SKADARSKE-1]